MPPTVQAAIDQRTPQSMAYVPPAFAPGTLAHGSITPLDVDAGLL